MAQLKDLIVNGATQLLGDVITNNLKVITVVAPDSSGSSVYGKGIDGQVLKTNGNSVYWGEGSLGAFIAEYGTTTNQEIETAISSGKTVFCHLLDNGINFYLPLARKNSATDHRFGGIYAQDDIYLIGSSCVNNSWTFQNSTQAQADWNATSGASEILHKPTQVSSFTNDAGYLTLATLPIYDGTVI